VKIFAELEKKLYKNLTQYGFILADFNIADTSNSQHRIRVFKLGNKNYWLRQCNGEIIEIIELT
jgi:hypothetical protein